MLSPILARFGALVLPITLFILAGVPAAAQSPSLHKRALPKMGTTVEIAVWHADPAVAKRAIHAAFKEVDRLEELLSEWIPTSDISRINAAAGAQAVAIQPATRDVLMRAIEVARVSGGAFDPTWAGLRGLWAWDRPLTIPSDAAVAAARARVGWQRLELGPVERPTARLRDTGMALGLGAIAKGYIVDQAALTLEGQGLTNYLVDGGGDVRARGRRGPDPWRVGLRHPRQKGALIGHVDIGDEALVTSGDYERFVMLDGVRYSHILDPRTGRPARGAMAVTVLAPDATQADALATAAFVLGPKHGLKLLEDCPNVEGLIVDHEGKLHPTSGMKKRLVVR